MTNSSYHDCRSEKLLQDSVVIMNFPAPLRSLNLPSLTTFLHDEMAFWGDIHCLWVQISPPSFIKTQCKIIISEVLLTFWFVFFFDMGKLESNFLLKRGNLTNIVNIKYPGIVLVMRGLGFSCCTSTNLLHTKQVLYREPACEVWKVISIMVVRQAK